MAQAYDIFLACAPKDFKKLPYVVKSIIDNVEGYDNIYICSPVEIPNLIQACLPVMYYTYLDINMLPGTERDNCQYRPNWSFQQHLKLFQQVTQDWYATIDCDTIINRKFKFFEDDKPIYWKGNDQYFKPYFRHMKEMIGLDKIPGSTSYVADMNLIYRPLINEMLERKGYTIKSFIEKSQTINSTDCCIGEPELYGTYVHTYHPDMYIDKQLKQAPHIGKKQYEEKKDIWSDADIRSEIERNKNFDYHTFSLHSWLIERGIEGK